MINRVIIQANLTRDPELRDAAGSSVCSFGIANNERFGKDKEITTFLEVECWGKTAEFVEKYFSKGQQILIDGKLRTDNFEDKEGNKRSKTFVRAEDVQFAGARSEGENKASGSSKSSKSDSNTASKDDDDDLPF